MCGIYGTTISYSNDQIKHKLDRFSFRGPDYQGIKKYLYNDRQLTFGHNRLSIIDLDSRSNQPFDYFNKISIVFNGEIYNYRELRNTLKKKGCTFQTESDTEVICAAYLAYGEDCLQFFNGMFAFVIYDKEKNILFGARDRLGKKPFYYYHKNLDFEFSSQISGIKLYNKHLHISEKAIGYYLAWRSVPDPMSIYDEVNKLKAGHAFTFKLNTGKFNHWPYWDVNTDYQNKFAGTFNEAKEELTSLLKNAVKLRLHADVPVGVFLSGGIDSSLISALAKEVHNTEIKTFSIKFNEKTHDESEHALRVAETLNTNHHTILCDYKEALQLIDDYDNFYDEPFADSSALPSMLLAKHTKKFVTVALTGDGGDETFLGYDRFGRFLQKKFYYGFPYTVRKPISALLKTTQNIKLIKLGNHLKEKDLVKAYIASISTINCDWFDFENKFLEIEEKKYLESLSINTLEKISSFETKTYLNWDMNTKVDRATMAFSLEARSPLMDFNVINFASKLPASFKFNSKSQKIILKDILSKYVPKEIIDRPKSGFAIPLNLWFKKDLKEMVQEELNLNSLKNIPLINPLRVQDKIQNHLTNKENNADIIWSLLVLKKWLNKEANL